MNRTSRVFLVLTFLLTGCAPAFSSIYCLLSGKCGTPTATGGGGGGGGGGTPTSATLTWTTGSSASGTTLAMGAVPIFTSSNATITLSNTGTAKATSLSMASPSAPFSFAGGSYPGTAGTCATTLAVSSTCTLVLSYAASAPFGSNSQSLTLSFNNGLKNTSLALSVTASTSVGPFNQAKGFDANAVLPSSVLSIASSATGLLYVGGSYLAFGTSAAGGIARFATNGVVDSSFSTGTGTAGTAVNAIAIATDGSGSVYLGGAFTSFNGIGANRIVRVLSTGAVDTAFAYLAGFDGPIYTIAVATDGSNSVYIGGAFAHYQGSPQGNLVKVLSSGALDTTFSAGAGANGTVYSILPAATGTNVYAAGSFTSYAGNATNNLVRFSGTGAYDGTFSIGTGANGTVMSLASGPSNSIYVGGAFTTFNSAAPAGLTRVLSTGTADGSWTTNAGSGFSSGQVNSVSVATDGSNAVYATGTMTGTYNGSAISSGIARFTSSGALDGTFVAGAGLDTNGSVISAATDGSGAVYVGGVFQSYKGVAADRFARIQSNGTTDTSFPSGAGFNSGTALVGAAATDGTYKVYVGGAFTSYNGTSVTRLARLSRLGVLDTTFTSAPNNTVSVLAPATDGSSNIYAGGTFTLVNGTATNRLARISSAGVLDTTFASTINGAVTGISPIGSSLIYAVGTFTTPTSRLARLLTSNGSADGSFTVSAFNNTVTSVAAATSPANTVYVCGLFTTYNGTAGLTYTARLLNNGGLDTTFATGTGFDAAVTVMTPQSDGTVYMGGNFTFYNGAGSNHIVRIQSNGAVDGTFNVGTGFNAAVTSISVATDGSKAVYATGSFTSYNGTPVANIARLTSAGVLDTTFAVGTGPNGTPTMIFPAVDTTSSVYVGGPFTSINNQTCDYFCRLESSGTMD